MAKMIGRRAWEHQKDDDDPIPKSSIRNEETRQWKKDAEQELSNDG